MKRSHILVVVPLALACLLSAGSALAGFSGSDIFLPMVGRNVGVFPSNWYTTVWIHNPGAAAATARIYLLVRNTANPSPPWVDVLVAPGDTEKIENVVESLFHVQVFGALRVTCATEKLVVTSRVYSKGAGAGEKDSAGQDFAGVPASFGIGSGEKTQVLGGHQTLPAGESDYRFNFGFVETTGHTVTVRVRAFDGNGADMGYKDFTVREYSQRQAALKDHFPSVSADNVRLEVGVTSGAGRIIAYGSGIANTSQDPTTFEMSYKDSLLGIANVQHDATLVGDGTAGAPLGLADGAVSKGKLSAFGGTAGQVLGTDGSVLQWQNSGLQLPWGGAAVNPSYAFTVTNSGDGGLAGAFHGISSNGEGLWGESTASYGVLGTTATGYAGVRGQTAGSGIGVYGQSGSGPGVSGKSYSANDGVRGEASGVNVSGVYGFNTVAGGFGVFGRNVSQGATGYLGGEFGAKGTRGAFEGYLGYSDAGVFGKHAPTGNWGYLGRDAMGVWGSCTSALCNGVLGEGVMSGVKGSSSSGYGVYGKSATNFGVYGEVLSGASGLAGVYGYAAPASSGIAGVMGMSSAGYGVTGQGRYGVQGTYVGGGNYGQLGLLNLGVYGWSVSGEGVLGESQSGYGVHGKRGSLEGYLGYSDGGVLGSNGTNYGYLGRANEGVYGRALGAGSTGVLGESSNGEGVSGSGGGNYAGVHGFSAARAGVWGESTDDVGIYGTSTNSYAGYFNGTGYFSGAITKPGGSFQIDHPLDPENKTLSHSFVESPDMMNIYNGNVVLDQLGEATVELPSWFEALNRDFRYQLTPIGAAAVLYIADEIRDGRFRIAGGRPGMKVSWQVTGIRQDAWANAHRIPVEAAKPERERGTYLHPEAFAQPAEKSVESVRHPEPSLQAQQAGRRPAQNQ